MKIWIDAQISPDVAAWLTKRFGVDAQAVRDVGHRDSKDWQICEAAVAAGAVVMTKDRDFTERRVAEGAKPKVIWVTCGNTSTSRLMEILEKAVPEALRLLESGEPLVEISDAPPEAPAAPAPDSAR